MPTVETYVGYVEVDVELDEFDTDDLIEELDRRGATYNSNSYVLDMLRTLYQKRQTGQDYTYELDYVLYEIIGRIS